MDDLASKLNDLLGSSDSMEKIRDLANMLGASGQTSDRQPEARTNSQPKPETRANSRPKPEAAVPEGDKDMMQTLMKMAPMLARFRQEDDSTRLLRCLRPFLSDTKKKKLDEAVKLLQFIRLIPYLKDSGLF